MVFNLNHRTESICRIKTNGRMHNRYKNAASPIKQEGSRDRKNSTSRSRSRDRSRSRQERQTHDRSQILRCKEERLSWDRSLSWSRKRQTRDRSLSRSRERRTWNRSLSRSRECQTRDRSASRSRECPTWDRRTSRNREQCMRTVKILNWTAGPVTQDFNQTCRISAGHIHLLIL